MASHESYNGVDRREEKCDSDGGSVATSVVPRPIPGERRKVALITGITGQDGSYLTEFLMGKGYDVHGLIRRSSNFNTARLDHLYVDPHNAAKAQDEAPLR
ncbi:hypothetical protein B296_00004088 [Ensete ventricosum]|uniref:GDP-mannose 4,6-dehydratase n=1 Tax=Ensete ventricosum TaxID=4639 RepID=A0A427AUB4_ENSVE|nr:hypothetical protein B296_00004088 [Ensete ventricosum]